MPCITLVIALFLILAVFQLQCRQRLRVYAKFSDIAILLDPPHSPIPLLLSARAQPNERLARIFGLGNSFVSAESGVRKQFIARARGFSARHTQHFAAFPDSVRRTIAGVASHFPSPSHPHQIAIPFATFVQVVTMWLVVCSFLGADMPQLKIPTRTSYLSSVKSMSCHGLVQEAPHQHTSRIFRAFKRSFVAMASDIRTPIGFYHPSYEIKWRVVAVTDAGAGHDRDRGAGQPFLPISIHQTRASTNISIPGRAWNISYKLTRYCASIYQADDWRRQNPPNSPAFQWGSASDVLIWRPCAGIHISGDNKDIFLTPCDFTRLDYHKSNIMRLFHSATDRCGASPSKRHLGSQPLWLPPY